MPNIKFVDAEGSEYLVEADIGISAMHIALNNGVPGIDGDCGGQAACATCHVYVDLDWLDKTGPADPETELVMLEFSNTAQPNSRLACQIIMTEELDGLILHTPKNQF